VEEKEADVEPSIREILVEPTGSKKGAMGVFKFRC
jgi:hypothetical protein